MGWSAPTQGSDGQGQNGRLKWAEIWPTLTRPAGLQGRPVQSVT